MVWLNAFSKDGTCIINVGFHEKMVHCIVINGIGVKS